MNMSEQNKNVRYVLYLGIFISFWLSKSEDLWIRDSAAQQNKIREFLFDPIWEKSFTTY